MDKKDYTILRIMNGEEILSNYLYKDLITPYKGITDIIDPLYIIYDKLIKKEKIVELLLDINKIKSYIRSVKINKLINNDVDEFKSKFKLNLLSFMLDNFYSLTYITEKYEGEYYENYYY